jgi:steroid delta-isomerase-like uncharacterized protein
MHQSTARTGCAEELSARIARVAYFWLLVMMLSACAREPQPSLDAFARDWIQAWDSHDVDRILAFYTDDAFYEDVPNVVNGWDVPLRGQEMIRESLVRTFGQMPDLRFELVSASGAGDRLVVEWIMKGTHYRDSTGSFSIRAVSIIKLEGDRIAQVSDYYDSYLLLSQLGIIPPLGAGQPTAAVDSAR